MRITFIVLILIQQLVTRVAYVSSQSTNSCVANSVGVEDKGSPYNSVNMFFWESSCQPVIRQEIANAMKNVCAEKNKSEEAIKVQNNAITTRLQTLESKINDFLEKAADLRSCIGDDTCLTGYEYYQKDNFCYKFYSDCMSWSEARQVCLEDGGDLISLNDGNLNFFKELAGLNAGACAGVWVGTTDIYTEGKWNWVNGEKVSSIFWHPKQPDNSGGKEHCGGLSKPFSYLLSDLKCSNKLHFLCQIA